MRSANAYLGLLLITLCLYGCAGPGVRWDAGLPATVELTATPFFPQETYQCGPAALATVINWSGIKISPAVLTPQVYLPERQGSLQAELIAAARRQGRVAYVLKPEVSDLLAEVAAGHPVVVLQNLGLAWFTRWHYAVVVGFDRTRDEIILRSGTVKRHVMPSSLFARTWQRGGNWALVVMPPERLPATAQEAPYLEAVLGLERLKLWPQAGEAYGGALSRWPMSLAAKIGLGNSRYAVGDKDGAEAIFRQATLDHPEAAAAFNNLAQVLMEQGRLGEAQDAAQRAVSLGGPLLETARRTLGQIQKRQREPVKAPGFQEGR